MQWLARSLSRLETQDIKTQPQFNHYLEDTYKRFLGITLNSSASRHQERCRKLSLCYDPKAISNSGSTAVTRGFLLVKSPGLALREQLSSAATKIHSRQELTKRENAYERQKRKENRKS